MWVYRYREKTVSRTTRVCHRVYEWEIIMSMLIMELSEDIMRYCSMPLGMYDV
jgi:hypothetical protein